MLNIITNNDDINISKQAQIIWAKTSITNSVAYTPLYVHMLDALYISKILWQEWLSENIKQLICEQCQLNDNEAQSVISWCAALHDIGKCNPNFQAGMTLITDDGGDDIDYVPRASGDDPAEHVLVGTADQCSPRKRG